MRKQANECIFRTGLTQTELCKHRRWLQTGHFGFRKWENCTIRVAKTKALINLIHSYEGGSENSVIGGVTLLIDMIDCFIIP